MDKRRNKNLDKWAATPGPTIVEGNILDPLDIASYPDLITIEFSNGEVESAAVNGVTSSTMGEQLYVLWTDFDQTEGEEYYLDGEGRVYDSQDTSYPPVGIADENRLYKNSNILDPIHDELDQRVFDGIQPRMRFFDDHLNHVRERFRQHGFNPNAFDFYLTGSICTYQYSETSDCDITVVCTVDDFTDIDRADLVQIVTMSLDGKKFPGAPYPFQHFVQPPGVEVSDLFKVGLRSAYDFQQDEWISPPDSDRVVDIQAEYPDWFLEALQWADKLNTLMDGGHYEDAYQVYKDVHARRAADMKAGLGDISSGNVIYKYLVNSGGVDRLRGVGYHIAT